MSPSGVPDVPAPEVTPLAEGRLIVRNSIVIGFSTVASKALLFLWQLHLAHVLGAAGYGLYGTLGAMLVIGAALTDLGTGLIVIREVAKRPEEEGRYLGATLILQPILAVAGYACLLTGASLLGYSAELRGLLALAGVSLLIDTLGNICHVQLLARQRMQAPAAISVVHVILVIVLGGAALTAGGGLWALYAAMLMAGLIRAAIYWIVLYRTGCRPAFPPDRRFVQGLIVAGGPLCLIAFLTLASAHADKLISSSLLGTESTGYLTAAFVVVFGVVELLSTPMLVVTLPVMARAHGQGHLARVDDLVRRLSLFNLALSLPLAVFVTLLAVPLSTWLFGDEFIGTADILRILIWFAVVHMMVGVFAQVVVIQNRQGRLLVIRGVGLTANIVLSLVLLPSRGVGGIALAALLGETLVLAQLIAAHPLPARWWGALGRPLWRVGVSIIGLASVILWLRGIHPLLAAVVAIPTYFSLVLLSRAIPPTEWGILREGLGDLPGPSALRRLWSRQVV